MSLTVYLHPLASYCQKVLIALYENDTPFTPHIVDLGDETFRLKKSFEAADKMGARYILIVGENEVAADAFALKHLASGEQVTVPRAELAQRILRK